jgi:predicted RNA binding protein YcfA (HicA-like mRNA interferase family)
MKSSEFKRRLTVQGTTFIPAKGSHLQGLFEWEDFKSSDAQ